MKEKIQELSDQVSAAQDWIADNTTTVYFASIAGMAGSMLAYGRADVEIAKYTIVLFALGIVYAKNLEDSRSRGRFGEDTRKASKDRNISIG